MATKRIGIFGGAFDPPHIGHVEVVRSVLHWGGLDEIWVIPAGHRVEKEMVSANEDRFHMCRLIVEEHFGDDPRIFVRDDQVQGAGVSFTIDLLRKLKSEHPDYEFWVIVGDDVLSELPTWKDGETLLKEVPFVIIERLGNIGKDVRFPKKYVILPRLVDISSTAVRELCKKDASIALYVPRSIEEYIKKKKLYRKEIEDG